MPTSAETLNAPTADENPRRRFWVYQFLDDRLGTAAYEWMVENPHVMDLYEHFALQAASTGKRFGVKLLTERIRWEVSITTRSGDDVYKINNNHSAYIARWLIHRHPSVRRVLSIRTSPGQL